MGGEARNLYVVEIELALNVWLNQDGTIRGTVAQGLVTPDEFLAVFSRWPTTLRPIAPSTLRGEVYAIVQPSRLAFPVLPPRRYQSLKLTITARRNAPNTISPLSEKAVSHYLKPMPILL